MERLTDVIVMGLGAMGSAAAAHLARAGHRVLGFDRFAPPHSQGSSHGLSRIFRQAYWEDTRYVRLLLRARELWDQLERESGRRLFHVTGCLMIAPRDGQLVARSAASARQFNLAHQLLSAQELKRRWPVFHVDDDTEGLLEDDAGYLVPEICIEEQLAVAARAGAQLHINEPVLAWSATPGGVSVRTAQGLYSAERLVITAGPWAPEVLGAPQLSGTSEVPGTPSLTAGLDLPFRVTRQVICWFEPKHSLDLFRQGRLPIYLFETRREHPVIYGFPLTGADQDGVKVGVHGSNELCTPETICRAIRPADESFIRDRLAETLPLLAGRLVRAETCLYTMTPDENFILGPHPHHPSVILAAGFSGHGFKFAPVIGEILSELVTSGKSSYDLAMFSPARFAPGATAPRTAR